MPGPASEESCQAAEGAATTGPQSALKPGHLRAAHNGGAEEAGGGTARGGERQGAMFSDSGTNKACHKMWLLISAKKKKLYSFFYKKS